MQDMFQEMNKKVVADCRDMFTARGVRGEWEGDKH